ncbi:MAG: trypsin-like peptidase domain-containing protein [Eubacteriales bacterium]|nr:trypsin-like peptidase domain-containing protein [Eubacteriales bacterium]
MKKRTLILVVGLTVLLAMAISTAAGVGVYHLYADQNMPDVNYNTTANNYILPTSTPKTTTAATYSSATNIPLQTAEPTTLDVRGINAAVKAAYQKANPSVVGIRVTIQATTIFGQSTTGTSEGSGVIYTTDGYIITNFHVVQAMYEYKTSTLQVFLESDPTVGVDATVVGYNVGADLAVLKIDRTGLPALEIGDSDELEEGDFVVAIGNPGGLNYMGSVSFGIVSGLNRTIASSGSAALPLIQTDAAINPGNSGGALLDINGRLVGINSAKIVDEQFEGMGFAIPSNSVKEICSSIIAHKDDPTPYIGITVSTRYSASTLQMMGYPAGAVVESVAAGSPAADAGIQRGDIIVELAGTAISDYTGYSTAANGLQPGQTVSIKIYRSGRYGTTEITVIANNS